MSGIESMLDKWKEGQGSGQGPKGKDPNKLFAHVWIIEEQYTNFSLKTERPYVMREKSHSPDCIYTAWPVSTKRDETGRSIFIPNGTIDKENWSPPSYIKMRVTYALHEEVIDKCEHKRDLPEDLKQEIDRKLHEWRNQALGRGYRKGPGKK